MKTFKSHPKPPKPPETHQNPLKTTRKPQKKNANKKTQKTRVKKKKAKAKPISWQVANAEEYKKTIWQELKQKGWRSEIPEARAPPNQEEEWSAYADGHFAKSQGTLPTRNTTCGWGFCIYNTGDHDLCSKETLVVENVERPHQNQTPAAL